MATLPNPRTWAASELVTAAKLNTDIRDAFNFFKGPPFAELRKSSPTTITAFTAVPWDVEVKDSDNGHNNVTNNTRYTALTAGYYHFLVKIMWNQALSTQAQWCDVAYRKNSSIDFCRSSYFTHSSVFEGIQITEGYMVMAVNDFVEVFANPINNTGSTEILGSRNGAVGNQGMAYTTWMIRWVSA